MSEALLEGWLSVRAALIAGQRDVYEVLLEQGKQHPRLAALRRRAQAAGVPVRELKAEALAALASGTSHGGVLARVGERRYLPLEELGVGPSAPFLAMLDGVEDPFNFGQALRALYAAGVHGLVLRSRNWLSAAATVGRASAGASELVRVAIADDDAVLAEAMAARGIQLVTTGLKGTPLDASDLSGPLLLIIGGERRGVSRQLQRRAALTLTIPYGRDFRQALDVTSATAVIAFEVLRQRRGRA